MAGVLLALASGFTLGVFQAFNRKASQGIDIYRGTFLLIAISAVLLTSGSLLTEDISLVWQAPFIAIVNFAIAGFIHFFVGWTLLTISQEQIGAARTGAIVGATPLWAAVIAFVFLDELLSVPAIIGILLIVGGVYIVSADRNRVTSDGTVEKTTLPWAALLTAICWASSSVFIRYGLRGLPRPLLGVTVGMIANMIAYAVVVLVQRNKWKDYHITPEALRWQLVAGILIGVGTWFRWIALDLAEVAVVLALARINVPVVVAISPLLMGKQMERVTPRLWFAAALIVAGSLVLTFFR